MNTSNRTPSQIVAQFSKVKTYGDLRSLLPETRKGKMPGIKQLRENAAVVLSAKTDSGLLDVYDNGYFTYTENDYTTVYAVDRCAVLKWYSCTGEVFTSKDTDLSNLPWTMPLEISGANRLAHNSGSRQESKYEYSLDVPASENNIQFSILPAHEQKATTENDLQNRKAKNLRLSEQIANFTPAQRELIQLVFIEKRTQEEAAAILGINQCNVSRRISTIKRLLKKFI